MKTKRRAWYLLNMDGEEVRPRIYLYYILSKAVIFKVKRSLTINNNRLFDLQDGVGVDMDVGTAGGIMAGTAGTVAGEDVGGMAVGVK